MRKQEVKARAMLAVASIVRVNRDTGEGDLWLEPEMGGWSEADKQRWYDALTEIADSLTTRANRTLEGKE